MIVYFLLIFIIILLTPYTVDIYINGKDFIKRLKIGRYSNIDIWYKKVKSKCKQWIKNEPVIKKTDNSHFLILDMIKGTYKNKTIQSWQKGMIFIALSEIEKKEYYHMFIDYTGNWLEEPMEIDYSLIAYGCLINCKNVEHIKPAMDKMYLLILSRYDSYDGCIAYRKNILNIRFVDTIGFVSAFLARYGKVYKDKNAINLSKKIILEYYDKGFHNEMLLPIHAYDVNDCNPLGVYGWGRGTGWFLLGLIDTYIETKDENLKHIINIIANKYKIYQKEDGSFSSNMQLKSSPESSITSMCAYFYIRCYEIFNNKEYYVVSRKCLEYLMKVTRRNGEVDFCQGDTKGIGYYSITLNIMPFVQGMTLRAAYLLIKQGDVYD